MNKDNLKKIWNNIKSNIDGSKAIIDKNVGFDEYETFSEAKEYPAGYTLMKDGLLYTFITDHTAGAWNPDEVEDGSLKKDIFSLSKLKLEQGTIVYNTGKTSPSDIRVRTALFVSGENIVLNTTGNIIMFVYKYKLDGTFLPDDTIWRTTSADLSDYSKLFKISFAKTDESSSLTVDEVLDAITITNKVDSLKTISADVEKLNADLGFLLERKVPIKDLDISALMLEGYYFSVYDGHGAPALSNVVLQANASYQTIILIVKSGDSFNVNIKGGGANARAYAIYNSNFDNIFLADGNAVVSDTINIEQDGYIVFNTYISNESNKIIATSSLSLEFTLYYYYSLYNKTLNDNKAVLEKYKEIEGLLLGNKTTIYSSDWESGYYKTNIETAISSTPTEYERYRCYEIECKENDTFYVSIKNGSNARGWNFLRADRTVITQAEGSYDTISLTITAPKDTKYLLLNTNDNTGASFVITGNDAIWERENRQILKNKKIAYIGDSAIDVGNREWPKWCSELLGADYQIFCHGGYTYANQFSDDSKTTYTNCLKVLVDNLINYSTSDSWTPDLIILQIGGNDLWLEDKLGTLDDAFSDFNYKTLAKDDTTYGGIRYNIQRLSEHFSNATIIAGTVFQRRGNDASYISEPIREVCYKLGIPVIDGNKYSGFSQFEELSKTYVYSDNPDGSNNGSRGYPQYNWVEQDGSVVSKESKTENAVKVYGKYTYDGTHKTIKGEKHIAIFMASQISSYFGYNDAFIDMDSF